jgi:hypothetical protein
MHKGFVTAIATAISLLTFASANPAAAKGGPPASGGYDALYQWCYRTIVRQHGWPKPGHPGVVEMPAMEGTLLIDECLRSHGKNH